MAKPSHVEIPEHLLENELEMDKMFSTNSDKYLLINLLSARARELNDGARHLIEIEPPYTFLDLAIKEASEGKLKAVKKSKGGATAEAASQE